MISEEFHGFVGDHLMNCGGHVDKAHLQTAKLFWNAALEKAAAKADHIRKEGGGTYGDVIRALKEE